MVNDRPTVEDTQVLELLVACEELDQKSAQFIEDCWHRHDEGHWSVMSDKQWQWFDQLAERYL